MERVDKIYIFHHQTFSGGIYWKTLKEFIYIYPGTYKTQELPCGIGVAGNP